QTKRVAAIEDGERFLAAARDVLADPHPAFEHDVHLVALLAFLEDVRAAGEALLAREGSEGLELLARQPLLAEEPDLVAGVDLHPAGDRGLAAAQADEVLRLGVGVEE